MREPSHCYRLILSGANTLRSRDPDVEGGQYNYDTELFCVQQVLYILNIVCMS